jgi:type II secretory pathway pseudopilin PulG
MRGHGLTVIEVLLALALFVLAAALAGPALFARVDPMTMESAATELESTLRRVREEARRTGEARLVYAVTDPERGHTEIVAGRHRGGNGADAGNGTAGSEPEPRRGVLMKIPGRLRVLDEREPAEIDGFGAGADDDPVFDPPVPDAFDGLGPAGPSEVLFLVCLPDGTVIAPAPLRISSPDGRVATVTVDPAIGLIRVLLTRGSEERGADESTTEEGLVEIPGGAG